MEELKTKLGDLTRLEVITDKAETEEAFMAVSEMIVEMTDGRIDVKTVITRRNEIINLVA